MALTVLKRLRKRRLRDSVGPTPKRRRATDGTPAPDYEDFENFENFDDFEDLEIATKSPAPKTPPQPRRVPTGSLSTHVKQDSAFSLLTTPGSARTLSPWAMSTPDRDRERERERERSPMGRASGSFGSRGSLASSASGGSLDRRGSKKRRRRRALSPLRSPDARRRQLSGVPEEPACQVVAPPVEEKARVEMEILEEEEEERRRRGEHAGFAFDFSLPGLEFPSLSRRGSKSRSASAAGVPGAQTPPLAPAQDESTLLHDDDTMYSYNHSHLQDISAYPVLDGEEEVEVKSRRVAGGEVGSPPPRPERRRERGRVPIRQNRETESAVVGMDSTEGVFDNGNASHSTSRMDMSAPSVEASPEDRVRYLLQTASVPAGTTAQVLAQLAPLSHTIAALGSANTALEAQCDRLRAAAAELEHENDDLRDQNRRLMLERRVAQARAAELEAQVERTMARLENRGEKIVKLRGAIKRIVRV